MKKLTINSFMVFVIALLTGCNTDNHENTGHGNNVGPQHDKEKMQLQLSPIKFKRLGIITDTLPTRTLSTIVEANGHLEVPPQHEATVTAALGANVSSIKVIEGDQINKGQVLAYMTHPTLTSLQSNYIKAHSRLQFLEKELKRQQRLYEEEVGAGKDYQEALAAYRAMSAEAKGLEVQLGQLHIDFKKVRAGHIYSVIPLVSPIDGYIEKVKVQLGQYVEPNEELFEIVNTEHVHADLMVFEKDVHKIEKGQEVTFTVESMPDKILKAKIYSVGKQFEQDPKAVHVHAEIENKEGFLIPGMYISGRIRTDTHKVQALPEGAVVKENGKSYIFQAHHKPEPKSQWVFRAIEVQTGIIEAGWIEVRPSEPLKNGNQVVWNKAYYLIAEMKKSQASHGH